MPEIRKVTVGDTRKQLCIHNPERCCLGIQNSSNANVVFIGGRKVSASGELEGIELQTKQIITWNKSDVDRGDAWFAICAEGKEVEIKIWECLGSPTE